MKKYELIIFVLITSIIMIILDVFNLSPIKIPDTNNIGIYLSAIASSLIALAAMFYIDEINNTRYIIDKEKEFIYKFILPKLDILIMKSAADMRIEGAHVNIGNTNSMPRYIWETHSKIKYFDNKEYENIVKNADAVKSVVNEYIETYEKNKLDKKEFQIDCIYHDFYKYFYKLK